MSQRLQLIFFAVLGWAIIALVVGCLAWSAFVQGPITSDPQALQRFIELLVWRGM